MSEQLNSGTYEIIQNRLNEQKNDLIQRLQKLMKAVKIYLEE
jgi:hypothetical protein